MDFRNGSCGERDHSWKFATLDILEAAARNNIDRDSAVQFFADLFLTMTSVATFEHFDLGGDPHGEG